MSTNTVTIHTGMGKSDNWIKLGLSKEVQNNLNEIGYSGSFRGYQNFENYLNSLDPIKVYTVKEVRSNAADYSAEYVVSVFEKVTPLTREISIIGVVKNNDSRFEKMKAAYSACKTAGIEIPDEVKLYFGDKEPQENNMVEVSLEKKTKIDANSFEIKVRDLEGIEAIRIVLPATS